VIAGRDQAHDLVADLLIRQAPLAVLVDRRQQHRQDVVAGTGGVARSAPGDLGIHDSVGRDAGCLAAVPRRPRQIDLELLLEKCAVDELERRLEHVTDLVGAFAKLVSEERAHDDAPDASSQLVVRRQLASRSPGRE